LSIFTTTSYPLSALVEDIDHGKLGLPEFQRPFVEGRTPAVKMINHIAREVMTMFRADI
jgi:hypothetical protein